MFISEYVLAMFVGLCLSMFVEAKLGISPGGIIVPVYISLVLDSIPVVLNVFLVSIITYLIVKYILSRFMLIYGKRRFIACVMIALLTKMALNLLYPFVPFSVLAFTGIGVVSSGILANCYFRQGVAVSIGACLAVSVIVFLLTNAVYLL